MLSRLAALACLALALPAYAQSNPKALVAEWLSAQNRGDFAGYQRLYAQQFTGIRRSGGKVVELDRAGWLKDRERMFKKPMVVSANQLDIDGDQVQFVQTWQSGSYIDTGRKQLLLVREGPEFRIAREELLESVSGDVLPKLDAAGLAAFKLLYPKGAANILKAEVVARPGGKERVVFLVFAPPPEPDQEAEPEAFELAIVADTVLARGKWDFDIPLSEGSSVTGITTYTPGFELDPAMFELTPGEHGIGLLVRLTVHVNGPEDGSVTRQHVMLFRKLDGKLRRVLSLQTVDDTSDAECSSGTSSELAAATSQTAGVTDLVEERTVSRSTFTGRDCRYRNSTTKRLWKWKGKSYGR